ncbi:MAG: hypothetical protein M1322_01515 [Candidatus Parvarchaeota archaeon]|nr:hypothetical protein [Candidatus Parvarchaeota archaeon]MCL5106781.1 hypothetical protein [Candidatus Parvarchaeota archaeon]
MGKNSLEKIVDEIKSLDAANYSFTIEKELYTTYNKLGEKAALDLAGKILENKADSILTSNNLKTISGTAKIISYVNLYNEIKTMSASYKNEESKTSENWVFYLANHNR